MFYRSIYISIINETGYCIAPKSYEHFVNFYLPKIEKPIPVPMMPPNDRNCQLTFLN
jgi:hypothetical protein